MLGRIPIGRTLYRIENSCQVRVQIRIVVGILCYIHKELSRIDEIPFRPGGVIFYLRGDNVIRHIRIVDALVTAFNEVGEVLTDKPIKKSS